MVASQIPRRENLEGLTKELLAERLSKFYQELKQGGGKDYSRSAHVALTED